MFRLSPIIVAISLGTSLFAQSVNLSTPREEKYALVTLTKYCAGVENFSNFEQPRIFAHVSSDLGPSQGWAEFENKAAWKHAGKPNPVALVWYRDIEVVRVAITSGAEELSYTEYCYRPDGSLAQFRSVPEVEAGCDQYLFHCEVAVRGGPWLYPPKSILTATLARRYKQESPKGIPAEDFNLYDFLLRTPLKPEKITFSSDSVKRAEYLSVRDLPFIRLLYASAKTK
jgi:hypothetical protein